MTICNNNRTTRGAALRLMALVCLMTWSAGHAQEAQQPTITPNFRDADLGQIIDAVSTITGKTFIIDPRVRAQVTILSTTPMSPDAFYEAFLSILQVHGFVAVQNGNVVKVIPDANARQVPANDLPERVSSTSDDFVTQVVAVRNVSAAQLVAPLRPLLPQSANIVFIPGTNTIVISDRAANVNRIMKIIQRLDQASDEEVDIIRLENASAGDVVRTLTSLSQGPGAQPEVAGQSAKAVADDRTNSVLLSGEQSKRLRMKALIAHLDTPLESGTGTDVIYLRYADAEKIAGKLKEQIQGIVQATAPGGAPAAAGAAGAADRSTMIWADEGTNALVITAPPKIMRQIRTIIDKLDIRRAQVLVEAILVEVSANKAAQLGVNWAVDGSDDDGNTVPIGTFNQPVGNASIGSIAAAIDNPSSLASAGLPTGLTLGAGRFQDTGVNFAVILRALRGDSTTNILQTPSIITLDNEEAEIKVAQEVPFVTGQYSSTGTGGNNGSVNPFQTIQRQEVGTILKITPKINEGTSVQLKIEQEDSGVSQGVEGAVDLVTNKRTISTTVLVEDGGVIVLGGLIRDSALEGEQRVPVLGAIPIIGELFKTRSGTKEKRNLMVFIRPTILRDGLDAAIETNAKYNVLREQQLARRKGRVTLLPGERQPLLPPIDELSRYADPTAGSAAPARGTDPSQPASDVPTTPLQDAPAPTETPAPAPRNVRPPTPSNDLRPHSE